MKAKRRDENSEPTVGEFEHLKNLRHRSAAAKSIEGDSINDGYKAKTVSGAKKTSSMLDGQPY